MQVLGGEEEGKQGAEPEDEAAAGSASAEFQAGLAILAGGAGSCFPNSRK